MNRKQRRAEMRDFRKQFTAPARVKHEKRWTRTRATPGSPILPNSPSYLKYRVNLETARETEHGERLISSYTELARAAADLPDGDMADAILESADGVWTQMTPEQRTQAEARVAQQVSA